MPKEKNLPQRNFKVFLPRDVPPDCAEYNSGEDLVDATDFIPPDVVFARILRGDMSMSSYVPDDVDESVDVSDLEADSHMFISRSEVVDGKKPVVDEKKPIVDEKKPIVDEKKEV